MRLNLNDNIRVKLTEHGKDIYYHQYDRTNKLLGREVCKPSYPKVDEDGYTTFQLWCFIELYGIHMGMTLPNVIEPLDIVFDEPTIELRCEECEAFDKTRLLIPQPERKKLKDRRCIDALELKCSIAASSVIEDGKHIFDIIDEQPTIEPERKTDGDTISRQAVINEVAEWMLEYGGKDEKRERVALEHVANGIKKLQSVQPEIIRCRDCRFNTYSKKCLNPDSFFLVPADDFYCGYAERRTDESD